MSTKSCHRCAEYFLKCKAEKRGVAVSTVSDDNAAIEKIGKQV